MKILSRIAVLLLFYVPLSAGAATRYATPAGGGDGTSWSSPLALSAITTNSAYRGDTVYISDGSYGSLTFSAAVSGTDVITIRKCGSGDGTCENAAGYSAGDHDGQATMSSVSFSADDWVLDGGSRGSDWFSEGDYGIVISGGAGGYNAKLINCAGIDNITVRYAFASFNAIKTGEDITENRDHGLYCTSTSSNITLEYSKIKNTSWKAAVLLDGGNGPILVQYCVFENIWKKELVSSGSGGNGCDNVTFRFNQCKNIAGTGILIFDTVDNWKIYGNWFWSPNASYVFTDNIIGNWTGDHYLRNETASNVLIYNNTFYQMNQATSITIQSGSGNIARNNLFIGFSSAISGLTTSNNTQNASTGIVANASNGDFHLASDGAAGTWYSLSTPYDVDMDGSTRGTGTGDIGAFEYTEGGNVSPTCTITIPATDPYTAEATSVNFEGAASDSDGTVSSVAWACPTCTPTSGAATGTTSWSFSATVAEGANTITVTATDDESATGQDSVVVFYGAGDADAPVISNQTPTANPTVDCCTVTLSMTVTDASTIEGCKLDASQALYDDMLWSFVNTEGSTYSIDFPTNPSTAYSLYWRCRDEYGNVAGTTPQFTFTTTDTDTTGNGSMTLVAPGTPGAGSMTLGE